MPERCRSDSFLTSDQERYFSIVGKPAVRKPIFEMEQSVKNQYFVAICCKNHWTRPHSGPSFPIFRWRLVFSSTSLNVLLSTGNLLTVSYGSTCGWGGANFLRLQSSDAPLAAGPLTVHEVSWVVSLLCIGGLVGNIVYGWVAERFDRKSLLMLSAVSQIVSVFWELEMIEWENSSIIL